ncbi:MAG: SDR family oxidoreductase [Anaerolineales bacterium]|nr:SDR family oxidoreductase [Anaerolineales bacterium]MBX3037027.1 SDR family oxidoreductase [Anaerolineales bacterium]
MNDLKGKTILITGAARRVGKIFAFACAKAGANVIIHHGHSPDEAEALKEEIASLGPSAWVLPCDLSQPDAVSQLITQANEISPLYALVNSASIFENLSFQETSLEDWEKHFAINLTAPFLLSQAFAKHTTHGRIVNILDWRALRPGADHFPYTITKSALASMTKSLAIALAPNIIVNGLALGAILPPADSSSNKNKIIENVPAQRWAETKEVEEALIFLLTCPEYITGEIIHLDGGRHLI